MKLYDIEVRVTHETELAWFVSNSDDPLDFDAEDTVLPKSEVELEWRDRERGLATVAIPEWMLVKKKVLTFGRE